MGSTIIYLRAIDKRTRKVVSTFQLRTEEELEKAKSYLARQGMYYSYYRYRRKKI